jgi:hypothetical protein
MCVGGEAGLRYDAYSVSVNYRTSDGRVTESLDFNAFTEPGPIKRLLLSRWSVAFCVRTVLETKPTYAEAVEELQTAPLIAPCYFVVAGMSGCRAFVCVCGSVCVCELVRSLVEKV